MRNTPETSEIREQHLFDVAALKTYMQENVAGFGQDFEIRQFLFGQSNPTFVIHDGKKRYVMRKKPPGKLLPSAHAVDREYRIISALNETDVPVARTYALCTDGAVIGTPFYVMDFVEGRVFRLPVGDDFKDAAERRTVFFSMNETLAKIHMVDWQALGLEDFGKAGNYMARQIGRWSKQYAATQTDQIESMDNLIKWLPEHIPDDDRTTIVHGDFRLENLIIHPTEPRVAAVLDWEISTLGHPLADLAYNCMGYHLPDIGREDLTLQGRDLEEMGIPEEAEYVEAYCRRTGSGKPENWAFFLAFSVFRLAAIVQGVYKRGLDGNASSETATTYSAYARLLANAGWDIIENSKNI